MKLNVGYTHSLQSDAPITIDEADYLAWCKDQYLHVSTHPEGKSDEELLSTDEAMIAYLNYDKQFLSELIGWGESDTTAFDVIFLD